METDSVSAIIKQKTEEMYSLLELKDFDGAENIADEIDELTQNRNIDTVRARVIIRRGRYKNNDYLIRNDEQNISLCGCAFFMRFYSLFIISNRC